MADNRGRTGHAWRQARAIVKATNDTCSICGKPVDKSLPYRDRNGNVNPMSASVDHVRPLARGGARLDLANLTLAHLGCNSRKGDSRQLGRTSSRRL